jgi:hypothetical protein
MPTFYFQFSNDGPLADNALGLTFANLDAACLQAATELAAADRLGSSVTILDEARVPLATVQSETPNGAAGTEDKAASSALSREMDGGPWHAEADQDQRLSQGGNPGRPPRR